MIQKKINFKILNPKTLLPDFKRKTKKKIFNHTQFLNYFSLFFLKNDYYLHSLYLKNRFDIAKLNFKLNNYPYLRPINSDVRDKRKFDQNLKKHIL